MVNDAGNLTPLLSVDDLYDTVEDDELWDHVDPPSSRRLLVAALDCFAARGYHATTTRQIAARAGMSPGAVYVHFASKADLLYRISRVGHVSALEALETATVADAGDPRARIEAIVRSFASWHARHHRLARVVQYELDTLPSERRVEIRQLRARFSAYLEAEIATGIEAGAFGEIDIEGAALAILSLCVDIARWYGPKSQRGPDELGLLYAGIVGRALRAEGEGRR